MSGKRDEIMDVAERMIRTHGYNGFSFREIAAEVGVKSASVHYHFATKADLAAAVARRFRERFEAELAERSTADSNPLSDWRDLFRGALADDGLMCLCGILAVGGNDLPLEVAQEARQFMLDGIDAISNLDGFSAEDGARIMAQLEGAMLLARSLGDPTVFDKATRHLV
ncbi:TetR/AcrR family transcriptional regulator [Tateyamaria omphalii]|uniref:TetR/AcrR family transcriptional regulator n=1 Tax=Tateyamaria omphalii TaxID=299262 RepID=UPI001C997E8E|nr:TetR/AcrR family transcriptional regulator [Tateyamaria omphalii]MBY5931487.1 TetR/AcrR family transcriptional regulator [Tateyamaria omphalii]